jgi:hypothetical protein
MLTCVISSDMVVHTRRKEVQRTSAVAGFAIETATEAVMGKLVGKPRQKECWAIREI